jgi:YegS/Rv2252/BmrU family lipid kinase
MKPADEYPSNQRMNFTIVANPIAGKGTVRKLLPAVRANFDRMGISYTVLETTRSGEAVDLARGCSSDVVVAMGGDGTINEVANGLAGSRKIMGVIPGGSGNDFIKSAGIPADISGSCSLFAQAKTRLIDLGRVNVLRHSDGYSRSGFFVNGIGIGFDATVAKRTREISYLTGTALYIMAVFQTLGTYVAPEFTISLDHATFKDRNLLIAIGNGRCAGGGFYLTPDAVIDDGFLDACVVRTKSILEILTLMPRVMRGKHHSVKGVKFLKEKKFTISSWTPFYVHADGEIVGDAVNEVDIEVSPGALQIVSSV